jgi:hypothetical protein
MINIRNFWWMRSEADADDITKDAHSHLGTLEVCERKGSRPGTEPA